ncbi:MAG: tetratricopeptide repeat protein [Acidobacteriota bacterium]|nr:tetratricopeptide repeat protein [Acidobacteriota bacterium]
MASSALLWILVAAAQVTPAESRAEASRAAYLEVIEILASGDRAGALTALATFETEVLGDRPLPPKIADFWRTNMRVVGELLLVGDAEVLVPIIALHHNVYPLHRAEGRSGMARNASVIASELTDMYADRSEAPDSSPIASQLFTSLGGYLQESWRLTAARDIFDRAIQRNRKNVAALVGLGTTAEKAGSYYEALPAFNTAMRLRPEDGELQLRAALCLKRIGRLERAESRLRELVEQDPDPWILSVAFQEMAGIHLPRRDATRSLAILEEGLERIPGNQQLTTQRALLLDRAGRPDAAARLLESNPVSSSETETARDTYNRWPVEWMSSIREEVDAAVELKRPVLQAALLAAAEARGENVKEPEPGVEVEVEADAPEEDTFEVIVEPID